MLRSKDIHASDAYTVGSDQVSRSIEKEIESSDFLVAVFCTDAPNANVLYEIGFARGAKKPLFLVMEGLEAIPKFLQDEVYVRASLDNQDLISFYMDQFLSKYRRSVKKQSPRPKKASMKLDRSCLEEKLRHIGEHGTEMAFIVLVKELFSSEGFVVDTSDGTRDKGVDMSTWIDSLEPTFGNPILIELKAGDLSEQILERTEERMRRYLSKTNSPSGLLIYFDRQGHTFNRSKLRTPMVIRIDIRDLIEKLDRNPIDRVLLQERNFVAHGS
jgi:hypothetical protein